MAWTQLDGTEGLQRTSNNPAIANFTMMSWHYLNQLPSAAGRSFGLMMHGETSTSNFDWIILGANDPANAFECYVGGSSSTGSSLSTGRWFHIAVTVAGTGANQVKAYFNGALDMTKNGDSTISSQVLRVGNATGSEGTVGRYAAVKVWTGVLTQAEIQDEMRYYVPQKLAGLNSFAPGTEYTGTTAGRDRSGNGYDFTVLGGVNLADGPPILWSPQWRRGRVITAAAPPSGDAVPACWASYRARRAG